MKIKVTNPKYLQLGNANSCKEISESENVKDLVKVNGGLYVITSTLSSHKNGFEYVSGYMVVLKSEYKGKKEPVSYMDHLIDVRLGKRKRGYKDIIIKFDNIPYVIVGSQIDFIDTKAETQTKIF